jgi:hypothetical protein
MKTNIPILIIILFASQAWGATYYVKSGGNDSLAGTSDETAWETVAKVEATVANGDTVYFRSQDTWSGSSSAVLIATVAGVTYDGSTYGSGTRATLQSTGGGGPYSTVKLSASNLSFSGFNIDMNNQNTGGIAVGTYSTSDVSGITINDCKVYDSYIPSGQYNYGIHVGGYAAANVDVEDVTITNTEVWNTGHEAFAIYPTWTKAGCTAKNILIKNCSGHDSGLQGGSWGDALYICNTVEDLIVEDSSFYNASRGVSISESQTYTGSPDNITIRRCLIYDNSSNLTIGPNNSTGMDATIDIYNNFIYGNTRGAVYIGSKMTGSTVNIYNNTIYHTGTSSFYAAFRVYNVTATGQWITLRNNILYATQGYAMKYETTADEGYVTHSNNLIFREDQSTNWFQINNTNYHESAVLTWDATTQNTNPLFNKVSADDYGITDGSDAIDNGADLSPYFTTDYYGNPRPDGSGFDIGAHEYQDAVNTSPSSPVNLRVVDP